MVIVEAVNSTKVHVVSKSPNVYLYLKEVGNSIWSLLTTRGHPAMVNVSIPNGGGKDEKSNIEVPKSNNVSLDARSSLNLLNTSSANEGMKNESQLEEGRKLPNIMTNSLGDTGSYDTVHVEDGAIKSNSTNGLDNNINKENRLNSGRRFLDDEGFNGADDVSENVQTTTTVENDDSLEAEADSSFELFRGSDELADEYSYDYDAYVDDDMWGDEGWIDSQHETVEDYVDIDSHILSTPVIADIDNDGVSEMVVAVSYFFDRDYYDNTEHAKELGGIDIGKYVAGGIVVFNLDTKQVKWTAPLDLSTDSAKFRAYIYSSPTVADLDNDGKLDILIGTSYGLFYILYLHVNIFIALLGF